jgi:hypothetical protein
MATLTRAAVVLIPQSVRRRAMLPSVSGTESDPHNAAQRCNTLHSATMKQPQMQRCHEGAQHTQLRE